MAPSVFTLEKHLTVNNGKHCRLIVNNKIMLKEQC